MKTLAIDRFRGGYRFLSNFYECLVVFEGVEYPSSEHAYQASKVLRVENRRPFMTALEQVRWDGFKPVHVLTCAEARRAGQELLLRPDWDAVRIEVMLTILRDKFTRHEKLKKQLLATARLPLTEGNKHGDKFWGVCDGVGENNLGKCLMQVRTELRASRG